jgi:hypothetical protein
MSNMNRRKFIQAIALTGSASLAGCETFLYGKEGNEAAAIADSELSEAATMLNNIELTADHEADISREDFEGYSLESVTQHTKKANEVLADDDSDVAELLLDVSTILEETAYQYESLNDVFRSVVEYEQHYSAAELKAAIQTGDRFINRIAEVTEHANTISQHLGPMYEAGYEEPVEGFSLEKWGHEQGAFLEIAEPMGPLGVGFVHQANGRRTLGRASEAKQSGDYDTAMDEAGTAETSFQIAEERFSASLELGLDYWNPLVKQLECQSSGFQDVIETTIEALEAYRNGNESKGNELWEQAGSEIKQTNQSCLGEN